VPKAFFFKKVGFFFKNAFFFKKVPFFFKEGISFSRNDLEPSILEDVD